MGNELTTIVPTQVVPTTSYLLKSKYIKSISTTRFLKSAIVDSPSSTFSRPYQVVKIFQVHDDLQCIEQVKSWSRKLTDLRKKIPLEKCPNLLTYQYVNLKLDSDLPHGVLYRDFIPNTILTTPRDLTSIEKLFTVFQILKSLEQLEKTDTVHGDIKPENVLLTETNHVFLTDFAGFKPSSLPANDPTIFDFFFDVSRRRACYIAPERFDNQTASHLTDIFSAGCCIAEIYLKRPIFTLNDLLSYRDGKNCPDLSGLENCLQKLVLSMVSLDSELRKSASEYLDEYREILFPDFFYRELYPMTSKWIQNPNYPKNDLPAMKIFCNLIMEESKNSTEYLPILNVVILKIFNQNTSKSTRLRTLQKLVRSYEFSQATLSDILLPILMYFFEKQQPPTIRSHIPNLLTVVMSKMNPTDETSVIFNLVLESIFQTLSQAITANTNVPLTVRHSLALYLGDIIKLAIEVIPSMKSEIVQRLALIFSETDGCLLNDKDDSTKAIFFSKSIPLLSVYPEINEHMKAHTMVMINHPKLNKFLFKSFAKTSSNAADLLKFVTLLEEGLSDVNSVLINASLESIYGIFEKLTEEDISNYLIKMIIKEIAKKVAPFLAHHDKSIVRNAVNVIKFGAVKLGYLKYKHDFEKIITSNLSDNIPLALEDHHAFLFTLNPPLQSSSFSSDGSVKFLPNVSKTIEGQVYELKKVQRVTNTQIDDSMLDSIHLGPPAFGYRREEFQNFCHETVSELSNQIKTETLDLNEQNTQQVACSKQVNEWDEMFGDETTNDSNIKSHQKATTPTIETKAEMKGNIRSELLSNKKHSRSVFKSPVKSCHLEKNTFREEILRRKRLQHKKKFENSLYDATDICKEDKMPNHNWRPKGRLIAQVSAIDSTYDQFKFRSASDMYCGDVKLAVSPDHRIFASGAFDGNVRLWKPIDFCQKMLIHRPLTTTKLERPIVKLEFSSKDSLVIGTLDGTIHVYKITDSGSLKLEQSRPGSNSKLLDFQCLPEKLNAEVVFANSHRYVNYWDSRFKTELAWSFRTDIEKGLLSCLTLPHHDSSLNWFAYGTHRGHHSIFDTRYRLEAHGFQNLENRGVVGMNLVNSDGPEIKDSRIQGESLRFNFFIGKNANCVIERFFKSFSIHSV